MSLFFVCATTNDIFTLSLHDALPIYRAVADYLKAHKTEPGVKAGFSPEYKQGRSEEHTSELQSHVNVVCRLLLEKKNMPSMLIQVTIVARSLLRRTDRQCFLPPQATY